MTQTDTRPFWLTASADGGPLDDNLFLPDPHTGTPFEYELHNSYDPDEPPVTIRYALSRYAADNTLALLDVYPEDGPEVLSTCLAGYGATPATFTHDPLDDTRAVIVKDDFWNRFVVPLIEAGIGEYAGSLRYGPYGHGQVLRLNTDAGDIERIAAYWAS